MTNSDLNKLSVQELRELRNIVTEMLTLKMQIEGKINAEYLRVGMTVKYVGGTNKLKNEKFKLLKINKVNAQCKSYSTGITWNIKLANIEPCEAPDTDLPDCIIKNEIDLDLTKYLEPNGEGKGER